MLKLELTGSGILYRNPLPGHFAYNAYLPSAAALSQQELLAAFRRGAALYAPDSVMVQLRSLDGGRSWQDEGLIWDPRRDSGSYSYGPPCLTRLQDTSLVLVSYRADRSDPQTLMVNPETGGFLQVDTILMRSSDDGHTWSAPEMIRLPDGLVLDFSGGIVELADGSWFLAFDNGKGYDDPHPVEPIMMGLFSQDRGKTWGNLVTIAGGSSQDKGFWHGNVIRLQDGRLFTLLWAADKKSGEFLTIHRAFSDGHGRNWSTPEPTGIPGQTSWAADLGKGRMVVAYTRRESPFPGIVAALSADYGKTWDLDHRIQIWDASGQETIGVAAKDTYPQSHDAIAFGRPHATLAGEGEVFVTYWCTDSAVTQARWARLRLA
ncbi:MAG: exo-alpha-sialidase [Chloroflexi bacterium]|nr:exo-alpha-sialidase [Chloroflexota bacterium]